MGDRRRISVGPRCAHVPAGDGGAKRFSIGADNLSRLRVGPGGGEGFFRTAQNRKKKQIAHSKPALAVKDLPYFFEAILWTDRRNDTSWRFTQNLERIFGRLYCRGRHLLRHRAGTYFGQPRLLGSVCSSPGQRLTNPFKFTMI